MKRWFKTLLFRLGYRPYKVESNRFWEVVQYNPAIGSRIRPSCKEWWDGNISGAYLIDCDNWIISFSDEASAAIFKLCFC